MDITIFGGSGQVAQRIIAEALRRGHSITAVVRDASTFTPDPRVRVVQGDAGDAASVATVATGAHVVINAVSSRPSPSGRPAVSPSAVARALIAGCTRAAVKRLVVVGGAGSLEVAPGVQLLDTPQFPKEYLAEASAHRDALAVYRAEKVLQWTYVSPPALLLPGVRTGKYRSGGDQLLVDQTGNSRISMEDFAVAVVDEVEAEKVRSGRFTVGY